MSKRGLRGIALCLALLSASAVADDVTLEPDTDRMGADYKGFALPRAEPEACRQACASDSACKAYTYVRPALKGPQAMCFLKSAAVASTRSDCCTSGAKMKGPVLWVMPQSAPKPQITPPVSVAAISELDLVEIKWSWTSQSCFPAAAGQTPPPCPFVKDIEGFNIYASDGKLHKHLSNPALRSAQEHFTPGTCYQVAAFKGDLESARSAPGCVDAGLSNATAGPVVVPQPKPAPTPITLKPASGIVLSGKESHANWNSACPLPETHRANREKRAFGGAFPLGYSRENNAEFSENVLSSGVLCNSWSVEFNEGSVMFALDGIPQDFASATLEFDSTSHCSTGIYTHHITLKDNASEPGRTGNGWFSWIKEDEITGATNNAPGESSTSHISVTSLVRKSLKAGKLKLGFVFLTDTGLKDDDYSCTGAYSNFSLVVRP